MTSQQMEELRVRERKLVDELFAEAERGLRAKCPHIRKDGIGAYCARGLKNGESVTQDSERRTMCDVYSLQLFCLVRDFEKCRNYSKNR